MVTPHEAFSVLKKRHMEPMGSEGKDPMSRSDFEEAITDMADKEVGAYFDLTDPACNLLAHNRAAEFLNVCAEHDVPVTVRIRRDGNRDKGIRIQVGTLTEQGLINDVHIDCGTLFTEENSRGFKFYDRMNDELARRAWCEINLLETPAATMALILKRNLDFKPKLILCLEEDFPVFDKAVDAALEAWRAELPWMSGVADVAFNTTARIQLMPERSGRFLNPVGQPQPVFWVFEKDLG